MILAAIGISLAVSAAVCAIFARVWRVRMRKELGTDAILGRFREEVSDLITEMNATTERNVALLENKIGEASDILEKARKTAAVLKGEAETAQRSEATYSTLGRSRPIVLSVEEDEDAVSSASESRHDEKPMDFESLSARDKALVLNRRGEGVDAIAAKLGMSRGEVELIISLHDRRR